MRRKKKQGTVWLEFELLQRFPEVKHGTFLNLDLGESRLEVNLPIGLELLDCPRGVKLKQCHGTRIKTVAASDQPLLHFDDYDGMVTAEKNRGLLIRHADCQAAIFYDPIHQVVGNVHCGWRGSVQNIYQKMVDQMKALYQTDPSDLIVCIGPSLGPNRAEFKHYKKELPQSFWDYQVRPNYFDFWEISRMQLENAKVPKEQIEIAEICTYESGEDYFSYRRNQDSLRHGTVVGISPFFS